MHTYISSESLEFPNYNIHFSFFFRLFFTSRVDSIFIVYGVKALFCCASLFIRRKYAFLLLWYRFLMELSDLPGKCLRISDHLFPRRRCFSKRILSSSLVQEVLFKLVSRTLTYRSRTCSPVLPGSPFAISTHLKSPRATIEMMNSSSFFCQFPRTIPGFKYYKAKFGLVFLMKGVDEKNRSISQVTYIFPPILALRCRTCIIEVVSGDLNPIQ